MELISREIEKYDIEITQEQIDAHIEASAAENRMTIEELKTLVTSRNQQTYLEWKDGMQYDNRLGLVELVKIRYADELEITEADALDFYQAFHHLFEHPEKVRASHILIRVPPSSSDQTDSDAWTKIKQILQKLKEGADFEEMAKTYSDCPSGPKGGDLGYAAKEAWVPEFSKAAFALETGRISEIIKTGYGYHIIKITDRHDGGVTDFETAKDKIIEQITGNRQSRLRQQYLLSLVNDACIEYAPGNLITMTPLMSL
jgi:parvulin-like peptidyl-prolyl isomerase